MIKVLLWCGGCFSSSYVSERMKKEIIENQLEDKISMDFSPFSISLDKMDDYDIFICCPHLQMHVKQLFEKRDVTVPIYILPPRIYGNMKIKDIYEDVEDLLMIYKETSMNPVHFPNEEKVLKVLRASSYRSSKK